MSGSWSVRIRIPAWTSGATISVNGVAAERHRHPRQLRHDHPVVDLRRHGHRPPAHAGGFKAANDNANVVALTYGPVVLSGNYGNTTLSSLPALTTSSVTRTSSSALAFTATANGSSVNLGPFYDAHGHNYTVYWAGNGQSPGGGSYRLVNVGSGLVLGIQNMSTADGGLALQWTDNGTADHNWEMITDGSAVRFRNANSGKVLGVQNMSTADNAARPAVGRQRHRRPPVDAARPGRRHVQDPQRQQREAARASRTTPPPRAPSRSRTRTTGPPTTGGDSSATPEAPPTPPHLRPITAAHERIR